MRPPEYLKAVTNLIQWMDQEQWAELHADLRDAHIEPLEEHLPKEKLQEILDEQKELMLAGYILEDFFSCWFVESGEDGGGAEINVVDEYLKQRGWRESVLGKRYLEALRDSTASLYEVVDVDPGRGTTVRDLFRGGDPIALEDAYGVEWAVRWDCFAGRLVSLKGKNYLTNAQLPLPPEDAQRAQETLGGTKTELYETAEQQGVEEENEDIFIRRVLDTNGVSARLLSQFWLMGLLHRTMAAPPKLQNTDGEALLFAEVRFPLQGDLAEIAAALDDTEAVEREGGEGLAWVWSSPGSPSQHSMGKLTKGGPQWSGDSDRTCLASIRVEGQELVLETNSEERAERSQNLLESRLGKLIGPPRVSYEDMEELMARESSTPLPEPDILPEVLEKARNDHLDDHYRSVLDRPLPFLGGETPREAAASKTGRTRVMTWLKILENNESRQAVQLGTKPYDVSWIWQELGIERSG